MTESFVQSLDAGQVMKTQEVAPVKAFHAARLQSSLFVWVVGPVSSLELDGSKKIRRPVDRLVSGRLELHDVTVFVVPVSHR